MNDSFSIKHSWSDICDKNPLIQATEAWLEIMVNGSHATYHANTLSQNTRVDAPLAMYPLALWFARSWWRLLYETEGNSPHNPLWQIAHEMVNAGDGYVWPNLKFISDNSTIRVIASPTKYDTNESTINYLANFIENIPLTDFQTGLENCIKTVLDRLDACSIPSQETELGEHWNAIKNEMQDTTFTRYRKLEAKLGFNPDEAEPNIISKLIEKGAEVGLGVDEELASAFAPNPEKLVEGLKKISEVAEKGFLGEFHLPNIQTKSILRSNLRPWEKGRELAVKMRASLSHNSDRLDDKTLCELIGLAPSNLSRPSIEIPITIAICNAKGNKNRFAFRPKRKASRRFQIARIIADKLISPEDMWLPVSDAATERQKIQRAFAGEFLCPFENLKEFMGNDFSEERIADAAKHFYVEETVAQTHLINHNLIDRNRLSW